VFAQGPVTKEEYIIYLIISLIFIIVILILFYIFSLYPNCEYVRVFIPNIIGGLVAGLFITLCVDFTLQSITQKQKKENTRIAIRRLWKETSDLLKMFVQLWKASVPKRPDKLPEDYLEFLEGTYYEAYSKFDLSSEAPIAPSRTWYKYFASVISKFRCGVDRTLEVYSSSLDPEFTKNIEDVVGHTYMDMADYLLGKEEMVKQKHIKEGFVGEVAINAGDLFAHISSMLIYMKKKVNLDYRIRTDIYPNDHKPLWGSGYRENGETVEKR